MTTLPQRISLVSQTVGILRQEIADGIWRYWLPGERALGDTLQVSRNTLRAALVQLKREGLIRSAHGAGTQILAGVPSKRPRLKSHDVALLSLDPLEELRPSQTLWIDEMRSLLSERGCRLRVFHGRRYFRANPGPELKKLVSRNPHGCWVLNLSNRNVQAWFAKSGLPCIVAGSIYPGIELPFRDLDHRAMCRHAAGVLLGQGHRRIALITHKSPRAGDVESAEGLEEGVAKSSHRDAQVVTCFHDSTTGSICQMVRRLVEQKQRPTALVVVNPFWYLTVSSKLAQLGVRIPEDMSVISRDEDLFLSFLVPTPARYVVSPHAMARTLLRPVLELLEGDVVTKRALRIMPEFIRGKSIAVPAA
ncbi:MAG: GntR family transcriptional regulator [Opitutus sp.]|nr:GntR family transcriptional regulator [Opitutus sp.]